MDAHDVRQRLTALRVEAAAQLTELGLSRDGIVRAARDSNVDDEHDPEGTTIAFEREMAQALIVQARARLTEVDAALARLDAGTYGLCAVCGESIGAERLAARPTTPLCRRHA